MVDRLARLYRSRPTLITFAVVFLAGAIAWGYDQRLGSQRVAERRRDVTTVCMFINDTRFEVRNVIGIFTAPSTSPNPAPPLPPELAELIRSSQEQSLQRAKAAQARLGDYDCDAFLRGEVPNRGPGDPPQR